MPDPRPLFEKLEKEFGPTKSNWISTGIGISLMIAPFIYIVSRRK